MSDGLSEAGSKGRARLIGSLFLISYAGVFIGAAIVGSALEGPERLATIAGDGPRITAGLLVEMINDVAVIGIAVMFYPLLRRVSEGLALWYVGVRIVEAGLFLVGKVSALSLIPLSEGFVSSTAGEGAVFEGAAELAIDQRYWSGELAAVAFMIGAVLLYILLYRSRVVPRFISVWGFLAVAALAMTMVFDIPDLTQTFEPAMLLYLPIVANELFLAGWLLVRGFQAETTARVPERPARSEALVG